MTAVNPRIIAASLGWTVASLALRASMSLNGLLQASAQPDNRLTSANSRAPAARRTEQPERRREPRAPAWATNG